MENEDGVDVGEKGNCEDIRDEAYEVARPLGSDIVCIVQSVIGRCDNVRKSNEPLAYSYVLAGDRVRQNKCIVVFEHENKVGIAHIQNLTRPIIVIRICQERQPIAITPLYSKTLATSIPMITEP